MRLPYAPQNILITIFMAELVKNDKGFKVIKLSADEASKLGWGISGSGTCICMHCNNLILGDIYYPIVLNDTMDKECYEEWYKDAVNYSEDRKYEERAFQRVAKLLNLQ